MLINDYGALSGQFRLNYNHGKSPNFCLSKPHRWWWHFLSLWPVSQSPSCYYTELCWQDLDEKLNFPWEKVEDWVNTGQPLWWYLTFLFTSPRYKNIKRMSVSLLWLDCIRSLVGMLCCGIVESQFTKPLSLWTNAVCSLVRSFGVIEVL